MNIHTLFQFPLGKPISSCGVISEISITLPSAGAIIKLFLLAPDKIGVIRFGFLKKYTHHIVKTKPIKYNGVHNQPIITVNIIKIAINGVPAGWIGTNTEVFIESMIVIFFPI